MKATNTLIIACALALLGLVLGTSPAHAAKWQVELSDDPLSDLHGEALSPHAFSPEGSRSARLIVGCYTGLDDRKPYTLVAYLQLSKKGIIPPLGAYGDNATPLKFPGKAREEWRISGSHFTSVVLLHYPVDSRPADPLDAFRRHDEVLIRIPVENPYNASFSLNGMGDALDRVIAHCKKS